MNVNEIVRLTLMPIIAAASRSCAVARIAFPCFVRSTSHMSAKSTGNVTRTTMNFSHVYVTPWIEEDVAARQDVRDRACS